MVDRFNYISITESDGGYFRRFNILVWHNKLSKMFCEHSRHKKINCLNLIKTRLLYNIFNCDGIRLKLGNKKRVIMSLLPGSTNKI